MSHDYSTLTYAADPSCLPTRLDSPDEVRALANAAFAQECASNGRMVYVSGSTRNGWAIEAVKALVDATNLPSLRFLSDEGQHRFETEHGFQCVSVLQGPRLAAAVADLHQLLELLRRNPALARHAAMDGSFMDTEQVTMALYRDYVSSNPAYDYLNVMGDEGEGVDYFFTWLRSVLRVAEDALSDGRAVIHELTV